MTATRKVIKDVFCPKQKYFWNQYQTSLISQLFPQPLFNMGCEWGVLTLEDRKQQPLSGFISGSLPVVWGEGTTQPLTGQPASLLVLWKLKSLKVVREPGGTGWVWGNIFRFELETTKALCHNFSWWEVSLVVGGAPQQVRVRICSHTSMGLMLDCLRLWGCQDGLLSSPSLSPAWLRFPFQLPHGCPTKLS